MSSNKSSPTKKRETKETQTKKIVVKVLHDFTDRFIFEDLKKCLLEELKILEDRTYHERIEIKEPDASNLGNLLESTYRGWTELKLLLEELPSAFLEKYKGYVDTVETYIKITQMYHDVIILRQWDKNMEHQTSLLRYSRYLENFLRTVFTLLTDEFT